MSGARVAVRVFAVFALAGGVACADREPTGIDSAARLALSKPGGDVQLGTSSDDVAYAISTGKLGVAIVGTTQGALEGQTNSGGRDAYVRLFDSRGTIVWTTQFGSSADDGAFGVAVDKDAVYVSGTAGGDAGPANIGASDGFVRKYDANGDIVWVTRLASFGEDSAFGVSVDRGAVYVTGELRGSFEGPAKSDADGYIIKLDAITGQVLWYTRFAGALNGDDGARAVKASGDAVFVAATYYGGSLGQGPGVEDAYVARLNATTGAFEWYSTIATPAKDVGWAIAYDAGTVFLAGPSGDHAFVAAFTALTGQVQWKTNLVTSGAEIATTAGVDHSTLHVGGWTSGAFPDMTNAGVTDAFHAMLNVTTGQILGVDQFGTSGFDAALGGVLDGKLFHLVGATGGALSGSSLGGLDAWWIQRGIR